jgi:hypothetical protein
MFFKYILSFKKYIFIFFLNNYTFLKYASMFREQA